MLELLRAEAPPELRARPPRPPRRGPKFSAARVAPAAARILVRTVASYLSVRVAVATALNAVSEGPEYSALFFPHVACQAICAQAHSM